MLKTKKQNHIFHILEFSLELFFLAFGGFFFVTGLAFIILKIKKIIVEYPTFKKVLIKNKIILNA
jgi:hypothetical protein